MLVPVQVNPERHVILPSEPPFMGFLRDRYPERAEDLFLYRHRGTGNFVVAAWANRLRGVMVELLALENPGAFDKTHVAELDVLLRPREDQVLTSARFRQLMQQEEQRELTQMQELQDDVASFEGHMLKKAQARGKGQDPRWNRARAHNAKKKVKVVQ